MSLVNVNAIEPSTGTDIVLGASGDTTTVPSGATLTVSGTMNASSITAGTLAEARGGTGTTSYTPGLTQEFFVYLSSDQTPITSDTYTKVLFDTEEIDTGSNFASYKYVAPSDGKYFFNTQVYVNSSAATELKRAKLAIYKNGASYSNNAGDFDANYLKKFNSTLTAIMDLSAADYIEVYAVGVQASSTTLSFSGGVTKYTSFMGWKM